MRKVKKVNRIANLLLAGGLVLGLFSVWQFGVSDAVYAQDQNVRSQNFKNFVSTEGKIRTADVFGKMYVPRFGKEWQRLIGESTLMNPVLNEIGVGHYVNSQLPGSVGNFAVAGHRGGFGGAFKQIHKLKAGDKVYVETNEKWFTYTYMQTKIVPPTALSVLAKVPVGLNGAKAGGKYLTMTTCDPIWLNTNRIVAWFKLVGEASRTDGVPKALKTVAR